MIFTCNANIYLPSKLFNKFYNCSDFGRLNYELNEISQFPIYYVAYVGHCQSKKFPRLSIVQSTVINVLKTFFGLSFSD